MKTGSLAVAALIGLSVFPLRNSAWAAEATVGADVVTAYVWRGVTFGDEGAVQPYIDVSHESGLGVNAWFNMDIGDYGGRLDDGEFSEVDLTLYYGLPIEAADITVGYIHYMFPQGAAGASTGEFFTSAGVDVAEGVSVGTAVYYDYDEIGSVYANFNAGLDLTAFMGDSVPEAFGLDLAAAIGWAGKEFAVAYGGTEAGFFDTTLSTTASYAITETASVSAYVKYIDNADSDVLPEPEVNVLGGVGFSYSF